MNVNEISNEMLAFQADFVYVHGAGKTRSVSGRPYEECGAFRIGVQSVSNGMRSIPNVHNRYYLR